MKNNNIDEPMYLSGGIFLSLVLDSVFTKDSDGCDKEPNRKKFMDDFKRIIIPATKDNNHRNYNSDISKYLSCSNPGTGQLALKSWGEGVVSVSDLREPEKHNELIKRVEAFINNWIDPEKSSVLVKRLLFILSFDSVADNDLHYIDSNGKEVTKTVVINSKQVYLPEFFLMLIWLCMIKRSKNNMNGRTTFEKLFINPNNKGWKYNGDIGETFKDITVMMPKRSELKEDNLVNTESTNTNGNELDVPVIQSKEEQPKAAETQSQKALEYIRKLIEENGITRTYFFSSSPKSISDVYLPISLRDNDKDKDIDSDLVRQLLGDNNCHRYIISGPAGCGKSLLAKTLAIEVAKNNTEFAMVPVIYDIGSFSESEKPLEELLEDEFELLIPRHYANPVERVTQAALSLFSPSDFVSYCEQGRALILLDGLEELAPDLKESFLKKLRSFMRDYGNNTIVIFSRPIGRFFEFETFTVLDVKPLSVNQTSQLIDLFFSMCKSEKTEQFKNKLMEICTDLINPAYLYENPLFLSILSSKVKHERYYSFPPKGKSIESFVRCLTSEDRFFPHRRYIKSGLNISQLKNEICGLCFYLVTNNKKSIDVSVIENYREIITSNNDYNTEDFLEDLCGTIGLTKYIDGRFEFIDDLLVEYFYVKYVLANDNNLSTVRPVIDDSYLYSGRNILDLLWEFGERRLIQHIYYPQICDICGDGTIDSYIAFLAKYFPDLRYYIGSGSYTANNLREDIYYEHIVRDFEIEEDICHLKLPAIEELEPCAVYRINKSEAKKFNIREGYECEGPWNKEILKKLSKKPVGYSYEFNVKLLFEIELQDKSVFDLDRIMGTYEETISEKKLKAALLSDDFPLLIEFSKLLYVKGLIEEKLSR